MMKSYKKMADEVLEAVNKHDAKKINRRIKLRIAVPSACCCLATVFALVVWQSGVLDKNGLSSGPENNSRSVGETTTEEQSETPAETTEATCTEAEKSPETTQSEYGFEFDICAEPENTEAADDPEASENTDITLIHVPYTTVTDDEVIVLYPAETIDLDVQTEDITEPEVQTETIPIDDDEPNKYIEFVENAHAPLDDYEFTLPLTPKDTDIILALLNAYETNDSVKMTQYALDIGVYLETGCSNVRTYIQAAKGDAMYALQDGKVVYADWDGTLGLTVWVENSEGTYIGYFHLNEIAVNEGDTVLKDHLVGYAGTTGTATSTAASYIRKNTLGDKIKVPWQRDDNKIKFYDDNEEPPKENILPVEPPLISEIQGGAQISDSNGPSDDTAVIYGNATTEAAEKYADIDGSLSYGFGKEWEEPNAPVNTQSTTLLSVSHDDERKYTAEEWLQILEMIREGKVFWED